MFLHVEYEVDRLVDDFTDGVLFHYVSDSFLNAYVPYVTPIKAYLLERYRTQGPNYEKTVWEPFVNDSFIHTALSVLDDDVLLLGQTNVHYYVFWFDCDVSDCAIGRRAVNSVPDQTAMTAWFDNYVNSLIDHDAVAYRNENRAELDCTDMDEDVEGITCYREIPLKCLRGWVAWK